MQCMNADLSNLSRLLQNLIRLGTIAEVDGAKARVQLGPKLTTEWLNWITQRAGSTCTWSAPTVGEQVMVLSPGGDVARGIILPALFSKVFDAPETSDTIHTTHYPDGAVVQYDHAAHALTATLPGGTASHLRRAHHHLHGRRHHHGQSDRQAIGHGDWGHSPEWRRERQGRRHQPGQTRARWRQGRQRSIGRAAVMLGMNATTGRALSGLAHIRQSITDILTTPVGSRLMRRRYGSEVSELMDQPLNSATVLRIYAATAYAIRLWEPRISLTGLQFETGEAGEAALILDGVADGQSVQLAVGIGQDGTP